MSKKQFYHSYHFRVLFFLFVFLSVSFIGIAILGKNLLAEVSEKERGNYLISFTKVLDAEIPPGGYTEIIESLGLEDATREKKIQALQNYLKPISDYVSTLAPGLGVGYYSNEFDVILTYGPSSTYEHLVGVRINDQHPGRQVMETNTPLVDKGEMVRGEILNAMLPIERDGKVIGYIWANQLAQELDAEFSEMLNQVWFVLALCFLGISFLLVILAAFFFKDIGMLLTRVEEIRTGAITQIPQATGKLGEVVQSINVMAEQSRRTNTDSARVMLSLKAILDAVDVGVFVYDINKKEIVYANKVTQTTFGYRGILGETFLQSFYHGKGFSDSAYFDGNNKAAFEPHTREFFIYHIRKNVIITEKLVHWHDGRVVLMLVLTLNDREVRDGNV